MANVTGQQGHAGRCPVQPWGPRRHQWGHRGQPRGGPVWRLVIKLCDHHGDLAAPVLSECPGETRTRSVVGPHRGDSDHACTAALSLKRDSDVRHGAACTGLVHMGAGISRARARGKAARTTGHLMLLAHVADVVPGHQGDPARARPAPGGRGGGQGALREGLQVRSQLRW